MTTESRHVPTKGQSKSARTPSDAKVTSETSISNISLKKKGAKSSTTMCTEGISHATRTVSASLFCDHEVEEIRATPDLQESNLTRNTRDSDLEFILTRPAEYHPFSEFPL